LISLSTQYGNFWIHPRTSTLSIRLHGVVFNYAQGQLRNV